MIDPKDVRLGNIINFSGQVIRPVNLNDWYDELNHDGILRSEPVPLTEEWLIKFGFTIENTVGGYLKWEIRTSKGRIIKLLDKKFTWGAGEYSDYILYVHQLQNLYWCLCGEELTIVS